MCFKLTMVGETFIPKMVDFQKTTEQLNQMAYDMMAAVEKAKAEGMDISVPDMLTDDNPEYDEAVIMHRRELVGEDIGDFKPRRGGAVIKVVAKKIEFIDIALKLEGYDLRYVWEA